MELVVLVPVCTDNCEAPLFLAGKRYLDFRAWNINGGLRAGFRHNVQAVPMD
jgi:hypothetical protein